MLFLFPIIISCSHSKEEYPNPNPEFDFMLLNEMMEKDSVFNEGENFTFYFSINSNDEEWSFNDFINKDTNFFRIYRIEGNEFIDVGTPVKSMWCNAIYDACGKGSSYSFKLPWITGIGENTTPDQTIYPPFCMFLETNILPKGKYVTYFDEQFEFVRCGDLKNTNWQQEYYSTPEMHFEVNFEIK